MYSVRNIRNTLKYNSEKIKIIREVELIIIDEISMVRADIIDFLDKILRVYCRNMREPFGGKQLLLVGDIFQLEPVVREDDRRLLSPFYRSSFFFNAKVFEYFKLVSIELKKVYRQSDPVSSASSTISARLRCPCRISSASTSAWEPSSMRAIPNLPSPSLHAAIR